MTGENEGDQLGSVVAPAGDVNGDGYADLAVSATGYLTSTSKVQVYQGNDGGGRRALATQVRGDISGITVQPWGPSYTRDSFGVALQAVHPLGRGRAKLQVQACPSGVPSATRFASKNLRQLDGGVRRVRRHAEGDRVRPDGRHTLPLARPRSLRLAFLQPGAVAARHGPGHGRGCAQHASACRSRHQQDDVPHGAGSDWQPHHSPLTFTIPARAPSIVLTILLQ